MVDSKVEISWENPLGVNAYEIYSAIGSGSKDTLEKKYLNNKFTNNTSTRFGAYTYSIAPLACYNVDAERLDPYGSTYIEGPEL